MDLTKLNDSPFTVPSYTSASLKQKDVPIKNGSIISNDAIESKDKIEDDPFHKLKDSKEVIQIPQSKSLLEEFSKLRGYDKTSKLSEMYSREELRKLAEAMSRA